MRKLILAIAMFAATGCAGNPLSPEYTCFTKLREYWVPDVTGYHAEWVVDHYTSATPCPLTPID